LDFFYVFWYVAHFGALNKVVYWINLNKVAYWINSNKVSQVHEINSKNTQFYLVLISSTLHYILPKYVVSSWCEICSILWKLKRMKRTTDVFYIINYICFHIESLHIEWVITEKNASQYILLNLILLSCQLTSFNWQRSMIKIKITS